MQTWFNQLPLDFHSLFLFRLCILLGQAPTLHNLLEVVKGTGVRQLTRGLVTLPPRWIQEPLVVRDRDGGPPR